MNSAHVPAGSIVVGVDGSPFSDSALAWASEQAALEQRPLTIVHSMRPEGFPGGGGMFATADIDYGQLMDDIRSSARALLSAAAAQATKDHPGLTVHEVLDFSDPRSTLLDLAENAAMLVVGSRGRGPVSSLLLGSVSISVSKHAACPVVVLRPLTTDKPRSGIMVAADGTEGSLPAIEFAYRMASWRSLPLTVLHCYWDAMPVARLPAGTEMPPSSSEQALVAESLAGMQEKFPEVSARVELARGFAHEHLVTASHDYDLIVIGHHPHSVLTDLVHGSVAPTVLEHASCAVAVVPALEPTADPERA